MAINTQRLLPPSKKSSSSALSLTGSFGLSLQKKSKNSKAIEKLYKNKSNESLSIVKRSLVDVDSILKSVVSEEKLGQIQKNIQERKKQSEERETKLEAPKEYKKFNLPKVSIPGSSFLDRIKRFLFFTALGWLFTKFQSELPRLIGIVKIITPIYGVVENIFKFILSSVVSFIERGYDTYDKFRTIVKNVGGEKAQEEFDKLSSRLNEYINYILIGGMALSGSINTFAKNARNYKPPSPAVGAGAAAASSVGSSRRPRVTTSGGGVAGRPDIRNPLRQRPIVTTGSSGVRAIAGRQAVRQLLRIARTPLSGTPIIGGLLEFGLSWALGEPVGKAAFRGIGTLLLGTVGSLIMPGFGTFLGGWAGAELAGKLYEVLFENKSPSKVQKNSRGGKIKRYAKGGQILGTGGRTLTSKKSVRTRFSSQQLSPGKDVGGIGVIKRLYPDPASPMTLIEWKNSGMSGTYQDYLEQKKTEPKKASPYQALTDVRNTLATIPYGIGVAMSAAIDAALGQNISNSTISSITDGIQQILDYSSTNSQFNNPYAIRNAGFNPNRTGGIGDKKSQINLKKIIGNEIKQKISSALMYVQKQLMLAKERKIDEGADLLNAAFGGNIKVSSDSPDFWLLVIASMFENSHPQGAADVAQAIYNRVSLPGWPKSIRGVILQPGQFQPVRDYGGVSEWSKISSKQSAISFAKKYKGYGNNAVERIAATLLNKSYQEKARTFVGPRDNFRSDSYEQSVNDLDNSTEVSRHGHTFGFEPGGANIGRFKSRQLAAAEVNKQIISGKVEEMAATNQYGPYIRDERGTKLAGDLGDFMKAWGGVPGSIWQHSRHGGQKYRDYPSYHNVDRAIDLGANANEQGPILKKIQEFNRLKGIRPVQVLHAGNDPSGKHDNHVHVAYKGGGVIPKQNERNDLKSLSSYPSYSDEGGFVIAIQPMIIEKMVPVSSGKNGGTTSFITSGSVNNISIQSLSRG